MADVRFYHLTHRPLEWALPKLLEKTLDVGARALVVSGSADRLSALDSHLWTYDPGSWLPHGSGNDPHAAAQPIWLSVEDIAPNSATYLFLTDGVASRNLDAFQRVFDLFDGRDEDAVAAARDRWRVAKAGDHTLSYWKQDERGRWEQAA